MNSILSKLYEEVVPKFNKDIVKGYACKEVPKSLEYIDGVFRSSMASSSPLLKYNGFERLTPIEEANLIINKSSAPKDYDVAGTDTLMVKLLITYNGEEVPNVIIPIPFVREAGKMIISGTPYHIVPVLTDTVISPSDKNLFVRLLGDKIIFDSVTRNFIRNGIVSIGQIVYSEALFRVRIKANDMTKVVNPIGIYLFGKFGLKETFENKCGLTPIIIDMNDADKYKKTHNIYSSTKKQPKELKVDLYIPHNTGICIPKTDKVNELSETLAYTYIYIMDVLPNISESMANTVNGDDVSKEIGYWRYIMSRLIFKDTYSADKGVSDLDDHYISLNSYIDPITSKKLLEAGMIVENFFDLITLILINYSTWLSKGREYTNNIYSRYIDILYYLLYDYVVGIHKVISDIARYDNNNTVPMLASKVKRLFNSHLSPRTIYKVTTGGINIALAHIDTTTDNMYLKLTSVMELQERGAGVKRGTKNQFPANTRTITGPDLYTGSVLFLPKPFPSPKARVNVFADFTETGRINPTDKLRRYIDTIGVLLSGRIVQDAVITKAIVETASEDGIGEEG